MKKFSSFISASLFTGILLLSITGCIYRPSTKPSRYIKVEGEASVTIPCDYTVITLSTVSRNQDVAKASADNADRMNRIQTAIQNLAIKDLQLSTRNFSIRQDNRWENGRQILGPYVVTNEINLIFNGTEQAGRVIDTAIKNGATELNSLDYGVRNTQEAWKEARIKAIKSAENNARLLAMTSGANLGKVISIEDLSVNAPVKNKMMSLAAANGESSGTPVSPQDVTITAAVSVNYTLE